MLVPIIQTKLAVGIPTGSCKYLLCPAQRKGRVRAKIKSRASTNRSIRCIPILGPVSLCKEAKPTSTTTCVAPQCDYGGYVCPTDFSRITDPTSKKCTAGAKCTAKECYVAVASPEPTPTPAPAPGVSGGRVFGQRCNHRHRGRSCGYWRRSYLFPNQKEGWADQNRSVLHCGFGVTHERQNARMMNRSAREVQQCSNVVILSKCVNTRKTLYCHLSPPIRGTTVPTSRSQSWSGSLSALARLCRR